MWLKGFFHLRLNTKYLKLIRVVVNRSNGIQAYQPDAVSKVSATWLEYRKQAQKQHVRTFLGMTVFEPGS